jgi:hypothetical protein
VFRNSFGKSHAGGQRAAARQRQGDFSELPPDDRTSHCVFGHIGQNWPQQHGNRMKTLTAKDAKCGFGRLIDLARAAPVAAVY